MSGTFRVRTAMLAMRAVFLALAVCGMNSNLAAGDKDSAFDAANKLYEQAKFTEAAAAYEVLLEKSGASPALHFNLGNAFFKAGKLGEAIRHYRIAEQMDPRDPDIQANLRFARDSAGAGTPTTHWWSQWLTHFSLNEWATLTTVSLWIWLGVLAGGLVCPSEKLKLRSATRWTGVVLLILAGCLAASCMERFGRKAALVTVPEAVARFGPLEESESNFTLRDGAEVIIQDAKDGWYQITDSQGRIGWLKEKQASILN